MTIKRATRWLPFYYDVNHIRPAQGLKLMVTLMNKCEFIVICHSKDK